MTWNNVPAPIQSPVNTIRDDIWAIDDSNATGVRMLYAVPLIYDMWLLRVQHCLLSQPNNPSVYHILCTAPGEQSAEMYTYTDNSSPLDFTANPMLFRAGSQFALECIMGPVPRYHNVVLFGILTTANPAYWS